MLPNPPETIDDVIHESKSPLGYWSSICVDRRGLCRASHMNCVITHVVAFK
ncbi:Hypothetical protein FKW44_001937 [Caligus rogercresseyi]|uniref:Uncharacterized protein n=1 Tax=Caligus rogercresseyi TaxID=217165 RepID=A0A7T8KJP1_CALRO|nr:Hypothetical protein FKW44_001937 [Caligus rogercresseyi]